MRESGDEASLIAGVDEVGRGPLAGPVVAAAVILNPRRPLAGLADSKTLSPRRREELTELIKEHAHAWAIGEATVAEIDALNILRASLLAMRRALDGLSLRPREVWVDGLHLPPDLPCRGRAIVGGDRLHACIGAASIIAKTHRDALMVELDGRYPEYGFARHKGYGTRQHLAALASFGATPIHRRGFAPVRRVLAASVNKSDQG